MFAKHGEVLEGCMPMAQVPMSAAGFLPMADTDAANDQGMVNMSGNQGLT